MKRILILVLILAVALLSVACGEIGEGGASSSSTQPTTTLYQIIID